MVGRRPTGLGVYALNCLAIREIIGSKLIAPAGIDARTAPEIVSPDSITLGSGKLAALKRQFWARNITFDPDSLIYSPTHHGFPRFKNQIITIHDLISLRFPRQHPLQFAFFKFFIPRILNSCRALFTVSEASKKDIVDYYGYPADRIYVIPNAIDPRRFTPGVVSATDPYLLVVGARYAHKNVEEIFHNHKLWSSRYKLIVTSAGKKYRSKLEAIAAELSIENRIEFHQYVSTEQLLKLYQGCTALVYPSKWEGFGIPPLEALACGRPVIVSDIPAHREVLADSAFFVKLGDPFSWQKAFNSLQDEDEVGKKVDGSKSRIAKYSRENLLSSLRDSLISVEPKLELL